MLNMKIKNLMLLIKFNNKKQIFNLKFKITPKIQII